VSSATTLEEVWKLFQETDRKFRETDRMLREQSAETDRMFRETDRKFQETDQKFQKTERTVKAMSKQIGSLGGKWGKFVENMVAPSCATLFAAHGVPVREVCQRVQSKRDDGSSMEIDILVVNGDTAVLVEVKSTLTTWDVRHHIKRLAQFKTFFPRYDDYQIMGAVAGIVADGETLKFARNQGLFVIIQSGENVTLANDPKFKPRTW